MVRRGGAPAGYRDRVHDSSAAPGVRPQRAPLDAPTLAERLAGAGGAVDAVEVVGATGSTNEDLVTSLAAGRVGSGATHLLVAEHQRAGRGRRGRSWEAPAGSALTFSLALGAEGEDGPPAAARPWYGFAAGLAVARTVRRLTGLEAVLKWPNDVLLPAPAGSEGEELGADPHGRPLRKCCGVLSTAAPGRGLVVGIGVDVDQDAHELPVATAVSLRGAGGAVDRSDLLVGIVEEFTALADALAGAGFDPEASGLAPAVRAICVTLGWRVEVSLPAGPLSGIAESIDGLGRLHVAADGELVPVDAGDVVHLRPAR